MTNVGDPAREGAPSAADAIKRCTDDTDTLYDEIACLRERLREAERERDEAREVAEASAALHAEDALPGGKVFSDAYARWVTAVEAWAQGAALRAGG